MKGVLSLNKAFWGNTREDFFRALIFLTENGKISWQRLSNDTRLDDVDEDDAMFRAIYQENQLTILSNTRGFDFSITPPNGTQVKIGNEDDPLVMELFDLLYGSQFSSIKKLMDNIIAEANSLRTEKS